MAAPVVVGTMLTAARARRASRCGSSCRFGCADEDFLRACLDVRAGGRGGGEAAGRLKNDVDAQFGPRQLRRFAMSRGNQPHLDDITQAKSVEGVRVQARGVVMGRALTQDRLGFRKLPISKFANASSCARESSSTGLVITDCDHFEPSIS